MYQVCTLYQPCMEHSSHARQQRQKASGLVLLGKDAPDHLVAIYQLIKEIMTRPLCQWILIRIHLIFGDDCEVSCPLFKPGGGGQEVPEI